MAGSQRRDSSDPAELVERWMSHRDEEPEPLPPPEPARRVDPPSPEGPRLTGTMPPVRGSTNVDFAPRTGARRAVGALLLVALAGMVGAGLVAFREPTTLTVGVAGTMLTLTLALWAIRAASPVARLSVRGGQLEVEQGGTRLVFDLSGSGYTPIRVEGAPGDRRWKVVFLRRSMDPFVIDSSMVDPHEFMDVLRRYRPT
jgi:hypothetical protein